MAINKVIYGERTLIDLSQDTVTSAAHIVSGHIGHLSDGSIVTGTGSGAASIEDVPNATGTTAAIDGTDASHIVADYGLSETALGSDGSVDLSEAIEALTTYSNEVTGESDTTLSEAVATLAEGYGSGGYDALYPLTNTRMDGVLSSGALIQENKGHVKISFPNTISGNYFYMNLTDAIASTTRGISIENRQKWFDIPTGSATHTVSNVSNTSNITWNANFKNLSTTSLGFGIGDGTHETGATATATITTPQSVGCYFVYIDLSTVSLNAVLEFDVSFTVNGIRYF